VIINLEEYPIRLLGFWLGKNIGGSLKLGSIFGLMLGADHAR
jgi:hypothetical protein